VPDLPPRGIFISYRRADALPYARLLKAELSKRFSDVPVFIDLDSIEAGLDFAAVIRGAINSCPVMVALIGPRWATLADERGRRRLDDPNDYVRLEIRTALRRRIRLIPVLVDGARPVQREQLPADLRGLAKLNALEASYDRYQYDLDRLIGIVENALAT
jgi:TIR domain